MSEPAAAQPAAAPLRSRLAKSAVVIGALVLPALLVGTLWHPQAAAPVVYGGLLGLVAVGPTPRRRLGLGIAALMLLLTPLAVVSGTVPLTGACFMALLCAASGIAALWGLQAVLTLIPLVLANFVVSPLSLSGAPVERTDSAYLVAAAALVAGGALWPVLLVPALARKREIPPLAPAPALDAVVYTVTVTVLASGATFGVLAAGTGPEGTWLIVTILAVAKLDTRTTVQRSAYRIVGTIAGAAIAAGLAVVVPSAGLQILLAVVALMLAMATRSGPRYWVYVTFLTLAVVLLSAPDEVLRTDEYRLLYNLIGAGLVLLAAALGMVVQHSAARAGRSAQPHAA